MLTIYAGPGWLKSTSARGQYCETQMMLVFWNWRSRGMCCCHFNSGDLLEVNFLARKSEGHTEHDRRVEMNVTMHISEELYRRAAEIAAAEDVPVEEFWLPAFERVLKSERLKERAARGNYENFRRVMSKVSPPEPPEYDRL